MLRVRIFNVYNITPNNDCAAFQKSFKTDFVLVRLKYKI